MGQIHASITLINPSHIELARRLVIDPEDIRQINVSALVDTGALFMVINENIRQYLELPLVDYRRMELAHGRVLEGQIVGPLMVQCMGETTYCSAIVLPEDSEPLLGSIPLNGMNLIVDSQRQELIPNPKPQRVGGYRFV